MGDPSISSKIVVLLFSDIVGSVNLKTKLGDAGAARLVGRHDALFRETFGLFPTATLLQDTGDGFYARFETASDAVLFALHFEHAIRREQWGAIPLKVRVGVHLGEVTEMHQVETGLRKLSGLAVDLAARVTSLAEGGQILMTRAAFDSARQYVLDHPDIGGEKPELGWMAHGPYVMKGSEDPVDVFEVGAVGESPLKAPEDSEKARRAIKPGDEDVLGWRPATGLEVPDRKGWIIQRKLGEGGFGEVWLGEHRKTKEHRAFKFCFDAERLRSFKRELTLFRLLRDVLGERDDIAHLYEVRLDKPPYFLESEFSECGNFGEWAALQGGIGARPFDERVRFVARVARAVAAAHSVGVLHKDIKPSNILIHMGEKGEPLPRLTDFGIGVLTDMSLLKGRNITVTGLTEGMLEANASSRTGTRMYAPPESIAGAPFTQQGDVYALGVLLYQCVIGDFGKPLAHGWERDVADPLLRDDIAACVAGDPARRLSSAGQLADRLDKLPERRVAAAKAKRNATVRRVAVAAAAVLAVVAGVAITMGVRERALRLETARQRDRAEANFATAVGLTHTFLHDFDSEIYGLRGSTPARELILKEAKKVLLQLQTQASDKPDFRRNLADAHDQVGELQAGRNTGSRLGEVGEAEASFAKARQIREDLVARLPNEARSHADVGRSIGQSAGVLCDANKFVEARAEFAKALASYDKSITMAAGEERAKYERGRMAVIQALGDAISVQADSAGDGEEKAAAAMIAEAGQKYDELSKFWTARAGAAGSTGEDVRMMGVAADELSKNARQDAALAKSRGEKALKSGANPEGVRLLSEAVTKYDAAKAAALKSAEAFDRLSKDRPQDAELRRDVYISLHAAGACDMDSAKAVALLAGAPGGNVKAGDAKARHEAALGSYLKALEITEGLARADEKNQQAQRDLSVCLNKVGGELRDLGKLTEAAEIFDRSHTLRESIFKADPTNWNRKNFGLGFLKRGEVVELMADGVQGGDAATKYKTAEALYVQCREEFVRAQVGNDSGEMKEVDEKLAQVRAKIVKAGGQASAG